MSQKGTELPFRSRSVDSGMDGSNNTSRGNGHPGGIGYFSKPDDYDLRRFGQNGAGGNRVEEGVNPMMLRRRSEESSLSSHKKAGSNSAKHDAWMDEIAETQSEHDALIGDINKREYLMRHTLSYWVSIMFLLGSCLFILGGFAEIYKLGPGGRRDTGSFITAPYIVGGFAYTFGCIAGYLATINVNRKDPVPTGQSHHAFRFFAYKPTLGYWSQVAYTVGGILFNVGTLATSGYIIFGTFTVGSVLFTVGASFEVSHNYGLHFRPSRLGWWISWSDLFGSILFLVGSVNGLPVVLDEWADERQGSIVLTSVPFIVGCMFFLFSSLGGLWMWKLEQYGNSYLPELNLALPSKQRSVKWYHLFFTMVYCMNITLSVTGISMAARCNGLRVVDQLLKILIPTGLLALSSAIHMIPEGPPFSYLLWWLRFTMLYQLVVDSVDLTDICRVHDT